MCDQAKSLATSFMCGKDLDNYIKNPYYLGPFTQGTRMLNKYRPRSTNPCIDHYENIQFEACCDAVKRCKKTKKSSNCGCKKRPPPPNCCCKKPPPPPNCGCKKPPPPRSLSCSSTNDLSSSSTSCTPSSCGLPNCSSSSTPSEEESTTVCCKKGTENIEEEMERERCNELNDRGRAFLKQIEQTKLPKIVVEEDEYLPSIMGSGWQIATQPKILGKSKFQITAFDPYLMLHSWQAMHLDGSDDSDDESLADGDKKKVEPVKKPAIQKESSDYDPLRYKPRGRGLHAAGRVRGQQI